MRISIITGEAGGKGKTVTSLLWTDRWARFNFSLLLLDLNDRNAYFYKALEHIGANSKRKVVASSNDNLALIELTGAVWLGRQSEATRTNSVSAKELPNLISEALVSLKGHRFDVVIVDTNLSLTAFRRVTADTFILPSDVERLDVLFNWSLPPLLDPNDDSLEDMVAANEALAAIASERKLSKGYKLIHVLNEFALSVQEQTLLQRPGKFVFPSSFKVLVDSTHSGAEVPLAFFSQDLASTLENWVLPSTIPPSYVEKLASTILEKSGKARPENIICVPRDSNIEDFMTKWKAKPIDSFPELRKNLGRLAESVVMKQMSKL